MEEFAGHRDRDIATPFCGLHKAPRVFLLDPLG
jgi:hypothetical protein